MRAESFYNFASYIDEVSDLRAYGGKSLHEHPTVNLSFLCLPIDSSTEMYPWDASNDRIRSVIFEPGWEQRWGVTPDDLQSKVTGARLTRDEFNRLLTRFSSAPSQVALRSKSSEAFDTRYLLWYGLLGATAPPSTLEAGYWLKFQRAAAMA